jgi:hypothetical protein
MYQFHKDAFSSGQIDSKLWLCKELENLFDKIDNIWIYGGWYGTTAFLLRTRDRIEIKKIYSYDIDPQCEIIADVINENWVSKEWKFKAFTQDCNLLRPQLGQPDLIINTSTEHFETMDWWNSIPKGTVVAIQGNNMLHDDHYIHTKNLNHFIKTYKVSEILYKGALDFNYPDWSFTRYMLIGVR